MEQLVVRPIITEKSLTLAAKGWYTFRVASAARKLQVANEVAKFYAVNVISMRTIAMHGKERRVGKRAKLTHQSDWKKAIVQLKKGQTISAFEVSGTSTPEEGKK